MIAEINSLPSPALSTPVSGQFIQILAISRLVAQAIDAGGKLRIASEQIMPAALGQLLPDRVIPVCHCGKHKACNA
jgi:hypothetical protein